MVTTTPSDIVTPHGPKWFIELIELIFNYWIYWINNTRAMKSILGNSIMTLSISSKCIHVHSIACASLCEVYCNGLLKKILNLRVLCYRLLEFINMHAELSKEGQGSKWPYPILMFRRAVDVPRKMRMKFSPKHKDLSLSLRGRQAKYWCLLMW